MSDIDTSAPAETLTYVSADGLAVQFVIERGTTGRLMPPVEIYEDTVPLIAGSRFRGARHAARTVTLPIVTGGVRYGRDELRTLARVLDPLRGMGALRVVSGQGAGRELACVYQAGLESLSEQYPNFARTALQFRATDPYWHDTAFVERDFTPSAITNEWFPIFPLSIAPTNVRGEFSVNNVGDADAWPETRVQGPGSNLRWENLTTGRFLSVAADIPAGRTLTITTVPGGRNIALDADNWFNRLDRGSTLWPFVPGFNNLRITYNTESARVNVRWRLRYLSP